MAIFKNKTNRNILILIGVLIFCLIVYYFSDIFSWIVISWVLSLVGQPLMGFLQKLKIGKFRLGPNVSAIITLFSFFFILFAFFALFAPLVFHQAQNLANVDYSAIAKSLEVPIGEFTKQLADLGLISASDNSITQDLKENLFSKFSPSQLTGFLGTVIGATSNLVISFFSIVFITFFFLKDQGLFMQALLVVTPNEYEEEIKNIVKDSIRLLTRYFGGIVIQVTIITIYLSVVLGIVGVPSALLIAFFAALINVIPYVGPMIGGTFGIFIAISSNLDADFYSVMLPMILKLVAVFASMQMLDNFLVQPYIFSNSVMAHPLEIFIIILVGAKLGGVPGMVLAIPVYTIVRVVASVFLSEFKVVKKLTEGIKEPVV